MLQTFQFLSLNWKYEAGNEEIMLLNLILILLLSYWAIVATAYAKFNG